MVEEKEVGKVSSYFSHVGVAAIKLSGSLKPGDKIHIRGHTTDFEQKVESIQIEHQTVTKAVKGQAIGLKVKDYVREHDLVYRIES